MPEFQTTQDYPFITPASWVRAAALCGFNIEPVFRELGMEGHLLGPGIPTVAPASLVKLMEICVVEARHSELHFPFVLGESFAFEYVGEIETYLTTSPTLRDALRVFDWLPLLINPQLQAQLVEGDDALHEQARLVVQVDPAAGSAVTSGLHPAQPARPARAAQTAQAVPAETAHEHGTWYCEARFAAIIKFARVLLGDPLPMTELRFRHAAPAHAARYEPFFRMPVLFGQAEDSLVFGRELLDRPLKGAYPSLHHQAEQRVELRLAQLPVPGALVRSIELTLADAPTLLGGKVDAMAARLHLHPRTLQRRLRDEGASWSVIQDRVRLRLASEWLRDTEWSIEDISTQLGFTDRRSFTQAYKRWTGNPPSRARRG